MARSIVNFMSYNSTGMNTIKTDWIRDLIKTCDIQFFQLQEHFKKIKTLEAYFKNEFPLCDSFVIPAHREPGQDNGRAKGGLAQLNSRKYNVRKQRIATSSWRLQAQILHFGEYKLLWINSYFPTDPQTINYDETELLEVMTEIENIIDNSDFDDILLGGDFNYDKRRNSGFVIAMNEFLEKIGLVSVWEKFAIDFTHLHTDLHSSSILDNFFMNEELLEHVVDAGPVHLGDNLSRHSPIMIKLDVGSIPARSKSRSIPKPRRPAWGKATDDDKNDFTSLLEEKLEDLQLPQSLLCADVKCKNKSHSADRDSLLLDIMSSVIECSHSCIPLSKKMKTENADSSRKCPVQKALTGWKENIAPLREDSLFWHSVWISAGRPMGDLHHLMASARNNYHYAVRKAKRLANCIRSAELSDAAALGDFQLLEEMKKTIGNKGGSDTMPDSLEGVVSEDGIVDKFKELYEKLYNSCNTQDAMTVIKEKLAGMITVDSLAEVKKVTGEKVKKACLRMKPAKGDVTESYSSDAFLHSPDILFEMFASIFQSFLIHGTVTLQILVCASCLFSRVV